MDPPDKKYFHLIFYAIKIENKENTLELTPNQF